MALYKDVEGYRKLFDEEYKKTRKLISEGETHLDNLAEGFSEASRVIDSIPTADVAQKSELALSLIEEIESLAMSKINADLSVVQLNDTYYIEALDELKNRYSTKKGCTTCKHCLSCEPNPFGFCDRYEERKEKEEK